MYCYIYWIFLITIVFAFEFEDDFLANNSIVESKYEQLLHVILRF